MFIQYKDTKASKEVRNTEQGWRLRKYPQNSPHQAETPCAAVLNRSNMMLQCDPETLQQELLKVVVNTRSQCIAVPGGQEDHRWEIASWGNILFYNLIVLMVAQLKIKIHWVVTL